jgi:hypothetical protein
VAAVAWLAELFDNPKQREKVLGFTQAFSSLGGLLVGWANYLAAQNANLLPAIYEQHEAWRYTLVSGVIPALPLILIRPFLPESPAWKAKRDAGKLRRPNPLDLFGPGLVRTTVVTTLMFAASYGIAFGAIQQLPQILGAPNGHVEIRKAGDSAVAAATAKLKEGEQLNPGKKNGIAGNARDQAVAEVTIWQEIGGLIGRIAFAFVAIYLLSVRSQLWLFQIPALIVVPLLFWWISGNLENAESLGWIKWGIFIAGFFTVAQFSFWGNYIPRVFPLHLRGTGESFAANIGGRILGTAAAWLTLTFSASTPPSPAKIAIVGAIVAGVYCFLGVLLSFWLKQPAAELLENE